MIPQLSLIYGRGDYLQTFFLESNNQLTGDFTSILFEQFLLEEEVEYNELIQEMMTIESGTLLNESKDDKVTIGERMKFALKTFFEKMKSNLNDYWQKIKLFTSTVLKNFSALLGDIRTSVTQLSKNLPKVFLKEDRTYFIFNNELKKVPKMMKDLRGAKTEKDLKVLDRGKNYKFNYNNYEETSSIEDVVKFYRNAEDLVDIIQKDLMNLEADIKKATKFSERGLRDISDLEKLQDRNTFDRFKKYKEEISFYRMKINTSSRMSTRMLTPIHHLASRTSSSLAGELRANSGRAERERNHTGFVNKVNMLVSTGVITIIQAKLAITAFGNLNNYRDLLKRLLLTIP